MKYIDIFEISPITYIYVEPFMIHFSEQMCEVPLAHTDKCFKCPKEAWPILIKYATKKEAILSAGGIILFSLNKG